MSAPTPEEFAANAQALTDGPYDPEVGHSATDSLMEETLRALGYSDGIEIIDASERWYA